MATATATMPIEQYLRTSYSPDADFVDGVVEERNLGEFEHARLQLLLAALIANHETQWDVIGVVEQRVRVSEDRVRICDVALLRRDSPREAVTATPPLACIEILSPEDRLSRAKLVLQDYLKMGVEYILLIDPLRRVSYTFDAEGLHEQENVFTVPQRGISIDFQALFERLD